jgi:hypothetical protein
MPAPLPLTSASYPGIRAALDVSLDATVLPDAVIALSIYQGAGERDVEQQDPDWATRTGPEATALQNAAIYYIAARLAPAIPALTAEQFGAGQRYTREAFDAAAVAADLRARGDAELALVLGETAVAVPTLFTTAHGYRGR